MKKKEVVGKAWNKKTILYLALILALGHIFSTVVIGLFKSTETTEDYQEFASSLIQGCKEVAEERTLTRDTPSTEEEIIGNELFELTEKTNCVAVAFVFYMEEAYGVKVEDEYNALIADNIKILDEYYE